MLNISTAKISLYPVSFRGQQGIRSLASSEDSLDRSSDSNTAHVRSNIQINAIQHTNTSINNREPQRWLNRHENFSYVDESSQRVAVTSAKVLMQLINEMGGGKQVSGPGRFLNIVI